MKALLAAIFTVGFSATALAQVAPPRARSISLSGPRFGITYLDRGILDKLKERDIEVKSTITQFGWQFEKQLYAKDSGVSALNEWVVLVGGLDQGGAAERELAHRDPFGCRS